MNKKINLEEIIAKTWDCTDLGNLQLDITLNPDLDRFKVAMLEFGKQLLELAASNAEIEVNNLYEPFVSKQSILDTIKQVEV